MLRFRARSEVDIGMSTLANPTDEKKFGVIYTPKPVVDLMLRKCSGIAGKRICDPSCGDGEFLVEIAERIYRRLAKGESSKQLHYTLENLTGFDIDKEALKICRKRLNDVARKYKRKPLKWNLCLRDGLDLQKNRTLLSVMSGEKETEKFDIVIGNPPYVRIQHLEKSRREKIYRSKWELVSGCSDLFIVFFEIGLHLLKDKGELVYITPNSWLKTAAGKALRNHVKGNHNIKFLCDFGDTQVFEGYTTYTSIVILEKHGRKKEKVPAYKCDEIQKGKPLQLKNGYVVHTTDSVWSLFSKEDRNFLDECVESATATLAEIASINVGIQTLADNVFIFEAGSVDLEKEITRRIFKASVMKEGRDKTERVIIYPYKDGKLIPENELEKKYPKAYKHLLSKKKQLMARDKGEMKAENWYGYGRGVSIVSGFGTKLLTSSINPKPNFQKCEDPDALFYSGYCVKPKDENVDIDALLEELNSERMERYIRLTSSPFQGGWFSYAKKYIQSFPVTERVYT